MANSETDTFNLVEESTIKGSFIPFFNPRLNSNTGFNLEVFRNNQYQFTLRTGDDQRRAHDGDVIMKINLGRPLLEIEGNLATKNGYTKHFKASVHVEIFDSTLFAIACRQQVDPIKQVRLLIIGNIRKQAERDHHDEISNLRMRSYIEQDNYASNYQRGFGVRILDIVDASVYLDPRRQRELVAEQERITRLTEIDEQARIAHRERDIALDDDAIKQDYARQQIEINARLKKKLEALDKFGDVVIDGQVKQLTILLEQGFSLIEIADQRPDLLGAISSLPIPGAANIGLPSANQNQMQLPPSQHQTNPDQIKDGLASQFRSQQEYIISSLGITIEEIHLDDEQIEWSNAPGIRGYQILDVLESSICKNKLRKTQIITALNEQTVPEPSVFNTIIQEAISNKQEIEFSVLFGNQLIIVKVQL